MAQPKPTLGGSTAAVRIGRRRRPADVDAAALTAATRADIIAAATREFVRKGYDGASINVIADDTSTSKRMLYYHFGSKRELYMAVLNAAHQRVWRKRPLEWPAGMSAMQVLRFVAEQTYVSFHDNEDFVRMIMAENMNKAEILRQSTEIISRSTENLMFFERILKQGQTEGSMRDDIMALDLYFVVLGLAFHPVSNKYTLSASLIRNLDASEEHARRLRLVGDAACRFAMKLPDGF